MNDAPVVFGDGANEGLIRAAGVTEPSAIVITYASENRCIECVSRLRKAFADAPIYVRSARQKEAEELKQAGATGVVVETSESAVRFAKLLGLQDGVAGGADSRIMRDKLRGLPSLPALEEWDAPFSPSQLEDLAEECSTPLEEVLELWRAFDSLSISSDASDDDEVPIDELEGLLIRTSDAPIDDTELRQLLTAMKLPQPSDRGLRTIELSDSGSTSVGFFDFVRLSAALKKGVLCDTDSGK